MPHLQRIAIAGASGYIGGRMVPRLLDVGLSGPVSGPLPGKAGGSEWSSRLA
ncbi:MAG: hypothetical protein WDO18_20790 [Acidobacteriota bacterium]